MNFNRIKPQYALMLLLVAFTSRASGLQLAGNQLDTAARYKSWSAFSTNSEYVSDFGRRTLSFRSVLQRDSNRTVYLVFRLSQKKVGGIDIDSCNPYKFSFMGDANLSATLRRTSIWVVDNTEVSMEEQCVKLSADYSGDNYYYTLIAKASSTAGNEFLIKELSSNRRDVTNFVVDDYKQSFLLSNTGFTQSLEELKSK